MTNTNTQKLFNNKQSAALSVGGTTEKGQQDGAEPQSLTQLGGTWLHTSPSSQGDGAGQYGEH